MHHKDRNNMHTLSCMSLSLPFFACFQTDEYKWLQPLWPKELASSTVADSPGDQGPICLAWQLLPHCMYFDPFSAKQIADASLSVMGDSSNGFEQFKIEKTKLP